MKRPRKKGGGANWMDTYGDMVTLLLCFFVLLYSISTIDESKWIALVRSFNPEALKTATETTGDEGPFADPVDGQGIEENGVTQEEIEDALQQLYETLQNYADGQSSESNIEVSKGEGYVFVSFNDAVFFDGYSYELRQEGKVVLDHLCGALDAAAPYIDEVRIMGHTAQVTEDASNSVAVDRILASNRASVSLIYVQEHSKIDPARLVSMGFGQWRPVDTNKTPEGRSHNRRVEVVITAIELDNPLGDTIEQYYSERNSEQPPPEGTTAG